MFGIVDIALCLISGHDWDYFSDDKGVYRVCGTCDHLERY